MRLLQIHSDGRYRPAVEDADGTLFDLTGLTDRIDGEFLANDGIPRARQALTDGDLAVLPPVTDPTRIGPPIARPGALICVGQNYAAHAAESGDPPPRHPVIFLKTPNTVVGPYAEVRIPRGSTRTDWEVELAVVIGRRARYLESPARAADCIAGYTVSNDVSERQFQLELSGGQWSKGKCCETFNPLGPYLVPAAQIPDPAALRLASRVNGEPRQDSTVADMIFSVEYLVWHLSQFLVLDPGDVINTGTPAGVALSGRFPYLRPGDVVELEITGLGRQRQAVVAAESTDDLPGHPGG